jgi:hypothetical protein
MRDIPLKSGDEYDALTRGGRRVHHFKPGERAAVKRKFRRRERRAGNNVKDRIEDKDKLERR